MPGHRRWSRVGEMAGGGRASKECRYWLGFPYFLGPFGNGCKSRAHRRVVSDYILIVVVVCLQTNDGGG